MGQSSLGNRLAIRTRVVNRQCDRAFNWDEVKQNGMPFSREIGRSYDEVDGPLMPADWIETNR